MQTSRSSHMRAAERSGRCLMPTISIDFPSSRTSCGKHNLVNALQSIPPYSGRWRREPKVSVKNAGWRMEKARERASERASERAKIRMGSSKALSLRDTDFRPGPRIELPIQRCPLHLALYGTAGFRSRTQYNTKRNPNATSLTRMARSVIPPPLGDPGSPKRTPT